MLKNLIRFSLLFFLFFIFSSCTNTGIAVVEGPLEVIITQNSSINVTGEILNTNDYFVSCGSGEFTDCRIIRKFGRNAEVSTSITPVAYGGNYPTPTTAVTLEVLSDDADDNSAGTGGREIILFGLNSSFDEINETLSLSGLSASNATTQSFIRLFRAYVTASGSYATQIQASHEGEITVRESGGGSDWLTIGVADTNFGVGQSQVGVYTIPRGWTGYLISKCVSVETNQPMNVYFFQRTAADDVTSPYAAMRIVEEEDGVQEQFCLNYKSPIQKFTEKTDAGFMAQKTGGAGTSSISVDFEILLIKNS